MVDSGKDKRRKAETLVRKASTCIFTGKYREGLELFDRALELDPEIPRAHSGRAVALAQLGRPADALKSAQEAIRLAPARAPAYTTLALCLDRMGRFDEAKSTYEFALTIRPENPQVLYNYACFWAAHGQEEKCRFFLTRAFQYLESGVVTHSKKDADLGPFVDADWFEELHAAAKLLEEGVSSFYAGRFDEALIAFEETLRGNKHHVRAHVGRSLALAQTGRAEEGLQSAERAIKLNADYAKGYAARAFCLHRLKRHDEAKATYEYAVNLAPDDPSILYNFACFGAEIADEALCREYLARAFENDDGTAANYAPKDPDMARYRDAEWFCNMVAGAKRSREAKSKYFI
jgi:Flp pilus assembly protein TadD